jgi:hypothetical protein
VLPRRVGVQPSLGSSGLGASKSYRASRVHRANYGEPTLAFATEWETTSCVLGVMMEAIGFWCPRCAELWRSRLLVRLRGRDAGCPCCDGQLIEIDRRLAMALGRDGADEGRDERWTRLPRP